MAGIGNVIILKEEDGFNQFWNGSRWVQEYPDALRYKTFYHAEEARRNIRAELVVIVRNYGLDDETRAKSKQLYL